MQFRSIFVIVGAVLISGCSTTIPTKAQPISVSLSYESATDDLAPTLRSSSSSQWPLVATGANRRISGPYLSVARRCNADRTSCGLGVVKTGLVYRVSKDGDNFVLEGEMTTTVSRQDLVEYMGETTISYAIPANATLIAIPAQQQKFRWVAKPGTSHEITHELGTKFTFRALLESRDQ
jgi:hypothetical protein